MHIHNLHVPHYTKCVLLTSEKSSHIFLLPSYVRLKFLQLLESSEHVQSKNEVP